MDTVDRAILDGLQYDFPLTTRPYSTLARRLSLSPGEVLERIARLRHKKIIRRIGAIFDSSAIGYHSVLAAFKVPPARLDEVARLLNAHPGVTHNYARGGEYNLWFTVTAPGDRDLSREVAEMARAAGVNDPLFLPAVKIFKIGFRLTMGRGAGRPARERVAPVKGHLPGVIDKPFVRALQKELPLCLRPYRPAARRLGLTEGQVTALLQRSMQTGAIRRVAAVLGPVQAGYPVNILTVWEAPPGKTADVGRAAAGCKQVSHCYERPPRPGWPYSVYAMIHGRSRAECRRVIRAIANDAGVTRYRELPTVKEFKKSRADYFNAAD